MTIELKITFIHEVSNIENDNIDINIEYNGKRYFGTVFTLANINKLMSKDADNPKGNYFWASNMLIVNKLNKDIVKESIVDLINDKQFYNVFEEIDIL